MDEVPDDIEIWFDELPEARKRALGHRLYIALEDIYDEDERRQIAHNIIMRMYVQDILDGLVDDGTISPDHIDDDGEIVYIPTEKGRRAVDSQTD